MLMCELEPMEYTVTMEDEMYEEYEKMITDTNDRDCENCVHARPFGGENDNRCDAWECEYINRKEAIKAYIDLVTCKECKYCRDSEYFAGEIVCKYHIGSTYYTEPDRFCFYGERREDERGDSEIRR